MGTDHKKRMVKIKLSGQIKAIKGFDVLLVIWGILILSESEALYVLKDS